MPLPGLQGSILSLRGSGHPRLKKVQSTSKMDPSRAKWAKNN